LALTLPSTRSIGPTARSAACFAISGPGRQRRVRKQPLLQKRNVDEATGVYLRAEKQHAMACRNKSADGPFKRRLQLSESIFG
jgi:hypothetical protein